MAIQATTIFAALLTVGASASGPPQWAHPGVLVGAEDIAGARQRLQNNVEPTASFFQAAAASPQGKSSYVPYGPPANGTISCGYYDNPNIGCSNEDSDVDAAYTQALLFAIGGDTALATSSRHIINLYSAGLHRYTNNTNGTCCGNEALQAAWISAKITRAAELLRHTPGSGWTDADTTAFNGLMYNVHLPLLYKGTSANGNWMASFLEGMLGIATFSENATLFTHAVSAWQERAPSYWYITSDGSVPPPNPQPNCDPQPVCEVRAAAKFCKKNKWLLFSANACAPAQWYNQTVYDARVSGVCQETCRDMGHMQMGFGAFLNGASTAALQGVDLPSQLAPRFFAASEFASRLLLNVTPPAASLMCSGAPVKLALAPTFEVAHNLFSRLGLQDNQTREQLTINVRPKANPYGSQVAIWETLSHGLPL